MSVTLIRGTAADLPAVRPIWLSIHHHHAATMPELGPYVEDSHSWAARHKLYAELLTKPATVLLLARDGSALVGYGLAHVLSIADTWLADTWKTGLRVGEIESLGVIPAWRNRGIGDRILEGLENALAATGVTDLILGALAGNAGAIRFYERRGYSPTWTYLSRLSCRHTDGTPMPAPHAPPSRSSRPTPPSRRVETSPVAAVSSSEDRAPPNIRLARHDEAHIVHRVVERAYSHYLEGIGRPPAPMTDDYEAKIRDRRVHVAVSAGEVVGLIVLIPRHDHLLVENVAVQPEHQGRGIGRALLEFAEEVAASHNLPRLALYTNAAMTENLELYPRLGYREIERRNEHGFERVYFSKDAGAR